MLNLVGSTRAGAAVPRASEAAPAVLDWSLEENVLSRRAFGMDNAVWMLMLSALAARLAAVMLRGEFEPGAAGEYGSIAAALLEGSGFAFNESAIYTQHGVYEPSSAQPPTYPFLLAGLYWLLGIKTSLAHITALLLNALLGGLAVPLIYTAARRAGAQYPVAVLAAAMLAFWPTQIYASTMLHPLPLATLLIAGSVALYFIALDSQKLLPAVAFGLVTALAALTEPMLLPALPAALVLVLCARVTPAAIRVRNALLLVACTLAIIGPWALRNWRVHGTLQPVTATFWASAWKGNNPNSAGTDKLILPEGYVARYGTQAHELRQFDLLSDEQRTALDGRRTGEREALWKQWAVEHIRQDPARYAQLCGLRLARTLWAEWDDPRSRDPFYVYFSTRTLLLLGTLVGLVLALRQGWRIGWPLSIALAVLAHCTLIMTAARYALPLEPLQLVLLALVVVAVWQRVTGRRERPPIVRRFARGANDGASAASVGLQD